MEVSSRIVAAYRAMPEERSRLGPSGGGVAREGGSSLTVSSDSLFQSVRRTPGREMLGVGLALLFFLLVGGSLLGSYRAPDHQRAVDSPSGKATPWLCRLAELLVDSPPACSPRPPVRDHLGGHLRGRSAEQGLERLLEGLGRDDRPEGIVVAGAVDVDRGRRGDEGATMVMVPAPNIEPCTVRRKG
jgi:hypothetical protein